MAKVGVFFSFIFNLGVTALQANNCGRDTQENEKPLSESKLCVFLRASLPGVKGKLQLEQIQGSS